MTLSNIRAADLSVSVLFLKFTDDTHHQPIHLVAPYSDVRGAERQFNGITFVRRMLQLQGVGNLVPNNPFHSFSTLSQPEASYTAEHQTKRQLLFCCRSVGYALLQLHCALLEFHSPWHTDL